MENKDSFQDPHTYRSTSIGCIMLKVLITHFSKGCKDGLYIIKPLQKVAYLYCWKLYFCCVNLTTACDHINRDFVFSSLRNHVLIFDSTGSDREIISVHKVVHVWWGQQFLNISKLSRSTTKRKWEHQSI